MVQEIDGLVKVLIGDETHSYREVCSARVLDVCRRDNRSGGSSGA